VFRNNLGPALDRIADHSNGAIELTGHHICDDGRKVRFFNIGFSIGVAPSAEVVHDEVDVLIAAIWDYRRRRLSDHAVLQRNTNRDSNPAGLIRSFKRQHSSGHV
jgi:hypothetical protein